MPLFKLSNGNELFYREWFPAAATAEIVLMMHGVESHSEWFTEVAELLTQKNIAALAYDRAGWGRSDGIPGHLDSYRDAIGDIEEIANFLRKKYARVHLVGLSWGGLFAAYAALRRGILFDSVIMIAPGFTQRKGLAFGAKMRIAFGVLRKNFATRVSLNLLPEDFTSRAAKIAYFRSDIWRNDSLTAGFAFETLKIRAFCRQKIARRALPPSLILLAQRDKILDNTAIREMTAASAIRVEEIPRAAHSLVFENPAVCAEKILAVISQKRATGKKIAILGGGAVGGFVGAMLALGGNRVTFIARPAAAEIINRRGIALKIGNAARQITENLTAASEFIDDNYDLLIVAVKSYDTESALTPFREKLALATPIVSLQNGVMNERKIREIFPQHLVFGGVICAYLDAIAPAEIVAVDDQMGLAFGERFADDSPSPATREKFDAMLEIFRTSGIEVAAATSIETVKWSKLCLNVAFNALNAATGLSISQIMADANYGDLAANALRETFAAMRAAKIAPLNLPNYPIKFLAYLCRLPASVVRFVLTKRGGGENSVSSMRQDLRKNSLKTEIDEINGAVVALAAKYNIPANANRELCKLIARKLGDAV